MRHLTLAVFALGLTQVPLGAAPITYVLTGNLDATLNGIGPTDAPFTITLVGDTGGVSNPLGAHPTVYLNSITSNTVVWDSQTFSFTDPIVAELDISNGNVGFTDPNASSYGISICNPAAIQSPYLATSLGPLFDTGCSFGTSAVGTINTTSGPLALKGADSVSFQAELQTGVPEPACAGLLATGLLCIGLVRRKSRA